MKFWPSLLTVIGLSLIAWFGAGILRLYTIFGVGIPYLTLIIFAIGFSRRLLTYSHSQRPIASGTFQDSQPSLGSEIQEKRDAQSESTQVDGDSLLNLFYFPSFFGTLKTKEPVPNGELRSSKWVWTTVVILLVSLLIILLRHLRLFLDPVPSIIQGLENVDSFLQIGFPHNIIFVTDIIFLMAIGVLLLSRIYSSIALNKNSRSFNYIPLFLLLGSVLSGIIMCYFLRVDIVSVKELALGLVTFRPVIPSNVGSILYIHIFLVSCLLIYLALLSGKTEMEYGQR